MKIEAFVDCHGMTEHTLIFGLALTVVLIGMLFLNAIILLNERSRDANRTGGARTIVRAVGARQ